MRTGDCIETPQCGDGRPGAWRTYGFLIVAVFAGVLWYFKCKDSVPKQVPPMIAVRIVTVNQSEWLSDPTTTVEVAERRKRYLIYGTYWGGPGDALRVREDRLFPKGGLCDY